MSTKSSSKPQAAAIPAWRDQFQRPCIDALLGGVSEEEDARANADRVLSEVRDRWGLEETVRWRGEPCGWTLDFGDTEDPVCFFCADPEAPFWITRLSPEQSRSISGGKPSRGVRETIEAGRVVGGRLWVELRPGSGTTPDDVLAVLSAAVGAVSGDVAES